MSDFWLDFPNFIVCVIVVVVSYLRGVLNYNLMLVLLGSCALPFLLNNVLFPASYMGDQFRYWRVVSALRELDFNAWDPSPNISISAAMLAMLPVPFVYTVTSLGFFNKFLYLLVIIGVVKKRIASHAVLLFIVIYPSLVLYTSLSLRDTLVMLFMLGSFLLAIRHQALLALLVLLPLWFIKFQNFFIMIIFISVYILFRVDRQGLSISRFLMLLVGMVVVMVVTYPIAIGEINYYRIAMFVEDGGNPDEIQVIAGFSDFLLNGATGALYFLIKPLPWEAENILQLIQSFENLAVGAFLLWLTRACWRLDREKTLFWILFLLGAFTIYGLVVFNYGTAARYRFPFLVVYVVCMAYDTGLTTHWQSIKKKSWLGQ
ncbi:MAG: hypothetical protein UMU75_07785 [Halomonas sp.]|nr:hypothetical protein [Halomonas sp.]